MTLIATFSRPTNVKYVAKDLLLLQNLEQLLHFLRLERPIATFSRNIARFFVAFYTVKAIPEERFVANKKETRLGPQFENIRACTIYVFSVVLPGILNMSLKY